MCLHLTLEGVKCPKNMQFEHKIYCSMCGTPEQAISDHKIQSVWQGGVREVQNLPQKRPKFGFRFLRSPKSSKGSWKWTQTNVRGSWRDHLGSMSQGPLTHFEASGGLQYYFWGRFWPSVAPAANLVKILHIEMACTGVPHIIPYISWWTRTFWGHFRPGPNFGQKCPSKCA